MILVNIGVYPVPSKLIPEMQHTVSMFIAVVRVRDEDLGRIGHDI